MADDPRVPCTACGRLLQATGSVEARIGPVCRTKRDADRRAVTARLLAAAPGNILAALAGEQTA